MIENRNLLLQKIPKNIILAELGVFKGEFSEVIMNTINPSLFYLVDLFEGIACSGNKDGNNIVNYDLVKSYTDLKEKYENTNTKVVKNTSFDFLFSLDDDFLDGVYIDADHSYEGVKKRPKSF